MKSYPSIEKQIRRGIQIYAFDKLDGSNVRAEWTPKRGFHKFGRRNGLLDDSSPLLSREVPGLILEKYGDALCRLFRAQRWQEAVAFFEFHGEHSFAGNHVESEPHTVTLFDIDVYKKGLMEPRDFIKLCEGQVEIPRVLHHGIVTDEFLAAVHDSTLEGMTFEGVVCKGAFDRKTGRPLMFKVKSQAWLGRLRDFCKGDERLFEMLA